ncbi:MAG TPA: Coenzyme F420 hydrogenase/dehydrogenase, beta subunit C-terminal domain [Syntrophomonadaceae bacterium]|nr:Coenzyme F420 hydrogenase/dehydrogenase, beta subunit C-terminal domain [Syntrophomonadaceae bacterium]
MPGGMDLKGDVLNNSICALCGACLDWCPYIKNLEDHLVLRFDCNVEHGRCYSVCPRTFTDWQMISEHYLPDTPKNLEIGPYINVYQVKANREVDGKQDGGTVTTLLKTALEAEFVEKVLLTSSDDHVVPQAILTADVNEVEKAAGSRFLSSPGLRKVIDAQLSGLEKMAVVGRPCQVQALRKLDYNNRPENHKVDVLSIGLFCMWSLKWDFKDYLETQFPNEEILRLAIPPNGFEVVTDQQVGNLPFEKVKEYISSGCHYCLDMTSELADISVGALETTPGWNTVIIRSQKGQELFDKAVELNYLVKKGYPEAELDRLKQASLVKKARAIKVMEEAFANGMKPFVDLAQPDYVQVMKLTEGVVK